MSSKEDDFDKLYAMMHAQVLGWCHRFYDDDHQLAGDIANEVWLQTWSSLDKLDLSNIPKTAAWLKVVSRRMCTRHRRDSLHLRRHIPNKEDLVWSLDSNCLRTGDDPVADEALGYAIWQLVDTLPERQRDCVTLKYFNELPVKDIADKLGITVKMAESALYKGRQALKQMYLQLEDGTL